MLVPEGTYHSASMQCDRTDMIYKIYLLLKLWYIVLSLKLSFPSVCHKWPWLIFGYSVKNWMHSFEVSLGYESVDRSTFSMKRTVDYLLLEITTPLIVYIWRRHGGTCKFGFEFHWDVKHQFNNHVTTS
jgi:hypothetical protein